MGLDVFILSQMDRAFNEINFTKSPNQSSCILIGSHDSSALLVIDEYNKLIKIENLSFYRNKLIIKLL